MLTQMLKDFVTACYATKVETDIEKKMTEYLNAYPHLKSPASIDMLRQAMNTWLKIKKLEEMEKDVETFRDKLTLATKIDVLTKTWTTMMANLGLAYTKQQYITKKREPQLPIERLKMLQRKGLTEQ